MKLSYHQALTIVLLLSLLAAGPRAFSQEDLVYKEIGGHRLEMRVYSPEQVKPDSLYPAMVFFFGGGFKSGNLGHFENHARYFAQRGLVCFLVNYRVESRQGTTPVESLKDARSAMRFVRANAERFNVDPGRIAGSGGSAGGHLAAACALVRGYDEATDDLSVSCMPNALVLFNPVIDNGPGGYAYERIGEAYREFSPLHNIHRGAPPTIIFLGTQDKLIPVETAHYYQVVMEKVGSRCELKLYEGAGHGFFNYNNTLHYRQTVKEADSFLQSLGYLNTEPVIPIN